MICRILDHQIDFLKTSNYIFLNMSEPEEGEVFGDDEEESE